MKRSHLEQGEWFDRFTYRKMVPFDLGESVFQAVAFEPGSSIDDHYHTKHQEVFFVHMGEGDLTIDGQVYPLYPGAMYHIEPFDAHAIRAETHLVIVIFKPHEAPNDIIWGRHESRR